MSTNCDILKLKLNFAPLFCYRYIHNQKVIHRDLKLGNMLLNEEMQVKVGDFGLATRVESNSDRKVYVCNKH